MRTLTLIALSLMLLPGCMVHESRELHRDYVIDYKTLSAPHQQQEMRVFAIANYCVDLLPEDPFFSALSSFFAPVVGLPTGILDLVCFPFKWTYGAMTLGLDDGAPAQASPEAPPNEGAENAPVPESPAGTPEQHTASK